MSTLDKYHAVLYPSNTISVAANLCSVYFISFAYLELYCISRISTEFLIIASAIALVLLLSIFKTSLW